MLFVVSEIDVKGLLYVTNQVLILDESRSVAQSALSISASVDTVMTFPADDRNEKYTRRRLNTQLTLFRSTFPAISREHSEIIATIPREQHCPVYLLIIGLYIYSRWLPLVACKATLGDVEIARYSTYSGVFDKTTETSPDESELHSSTSTTTKVDRHWPRIVYLQPIDAFSEGIRPWRSHIGQNLRDS